MVTTSRLGLNKPEGSDLCIVETSLNEQLDIIDNKAVSTLISNTAPIAEFLGQEWWKPNTKQFYFWNGSDWTEVNLTVTGPPPLPTGKKAITIASNTSDSSTISSTESTSPFLPTTFAATLDKRYEITACGTLATAGFDDNAADVMINLRIASGGSVTNAGSIVHRTGSSRSEYSWSTIDHHYSFRATWKATATGNFTVGLFLKRETTGLDPDISFKGNVYHVLTIEETGN